MRLGFSFFIAGTIIVFAQPSWADKLPKNAVELSPDEVMQIYSGTTGIYSISDEYFAADGTVKGVFGKPKITNTFKGTWTVSGNEMCAKNKAKGDPKLYTDCNKFWRSGKKIYSLWSVHYDGSKADEKNGYYTNELRMHKKGDLVSKKYAAAGGE